MKRRTALKSAAGVIAGVGLYDPVSPVNEQPQVVDIIPRPHHVSQSVDPDVPITHRFAWTTVADEGPDTLHDVLDATSYQAYFDDEPLPQPENYWRTIQPKGDDQWRLEWSYQLPSVSTGHHEIRVIISYDRPYTSKISGGYEKTRTGSEVLSGEYTVLDS